MTTSKTTRSVFMESLAAIGLSMMLGACAPAVAQEAQEAAAMKAALRAHGLEADASGTEVIASWNAKAHEIAFAEDQFLTFKGQRALAMMHIAMHDALNSIVPVYDRYALAGKRVIAHPVPAAAQAAFDVLASQYPDQHARLSVELARWIDSVSSGALRERAVDLGHAAAQAILARRAEDGFAFQGTYEFRQGPGQYQTTPPWNGFVAQPGFRFARPFALSGPDQFRPPAPPALSSAAYARAFREVKEQGASTGSQRTEDQTAYAIWWMEFAEGSVNRLARQLTADQRTHPWTTARLFAHLGIVLFDSYIAIWDSKYEFNAWRPFTAVRAADGDGNPRTVADPNWTPLRPAPPHPEHASAHAAACAASFGVLERTLGSDVQFTMETTTAPPGMPTRTFASFRAAAAECADSRVRLGWHFRYATDAGLALGRDIARHTVRHTLRRSR